MLGQEYLVKAFHIPVGELVAFCNGYGNRLFRALSLERQAAAKPDSRLR